MYVIRTSTHARTRACMHTRVLEYSRVLRTYVRTYTRPLLALLTAPCAPSQRNERNALSVHAAVNQHHSIAVSDDDAVLIIMVDWIACMRQ